MVFIDKRSSVMNVRSPRSFIDTGFIYYNIESRVYHPVCHGALLALFKYYYSNKDILKPINESLISSEKFIHKIQKGVSIKVQDCQSIINGIKDKKIIFDFPEIHFLMYMSTAFIPRNNTKYVALYLPSEENFVYWDLIIHQPKTESTKETLFFIQMFDIHTHDTSNGIRKSFEKGQLKNIIKGITGRDSNPKIIENANEYPIMDAGCVDLDVKFFYITGSERSLMEKYEKVKY